MFFKNTAEPQPLCHTVKRITDTERVYCLKPAMVALTMNMPNMDTIVLCPDCARGLAKEIIDSVPGAPGDTRKRR